MADYVQIRHSIWTDEDFLALTAAAQRMYLLLTSQPDMNHAGILVYRPRRWSKLAKGMTVEDVEASLAELEAAWFIAIDHDAEELLVRSVIRIDEKFKQPFVFVAACKGVSGTLSRTLRGILRSELERLPLDELSDSVRPKVEKQLFPLLKTLPEAIHKPSTEPFAEGSPEGSTEPIAKPNGEGEGVGSNGSTENETSKSKTAPRAPRNQKQSRKDGPEGERAEVIMKGFWELTKGICNYNAVYGIVLKAIKGGAEDRAIVAALKAIVATGKPVTADTMRAALDHPAGRPPLRAVAATAPTVASGRLEASAESWGL